jgi:hypothetical protein
MNLWVDDIRKEPEGWLRAKTVTDAIRMLDTLSISCVSLDHDISMKVSVGYGDARPFASPETFEAVARFIAWRFEPEMIDVKIHTASPVGAEKMAAILSNFNPTVKLSAPCNRFEE